MKNKKRKLVIAVLSMVMLLGTASMSFADTTTTVLVGDRLSNTSAYTSATAGFNRKADTVKCTVTLQEKYSGGWRTATGLVVTQYSKTSYNTSSINVKRNLALIKGKVYRLKVAFTDTGNGVTNTDYYYSSTF